MSTVTLPPHPPKEHWLFGNALFLIENPMPYLQEQMAKHEGIYRILSLVKKIVVIDKPEYVKYVLQENNRNYTKSFGYDVLSDLLGKGLLTSEGDYWLKQRRLAQPAFHRDRLALLADTMVTCTQELIDRLDSYPKGQQINLAKEMMSVTLHIVARSMFSSDVKDVVETVGREIDISNEFAIERIRNPFKFPRWVPTPTNLEEQRSIKALNEVVGKIIADRRKSKERYDDLLQMLMDVKDEDTGEQMTDRQLRDECMTIFLAGHETTALALSWLWYLLYLNPEQATKLQEEVDTVLQGKTPTLADLPKLEYIRLVVDETLRMYPPAWIIGRRNIEDDEIGGFSIPAGYNILMPVFAIHRDPKIWEEPDSFKPERFKKENMQDKHRYAYFPFGGGPRFCIGNNFAIMEMQIVVAMLVQKFQFSIDDSFDNTPDPLITLRPKGGNMSAHFTKR